MHLVFILRRSAIPMSHSLAHMNPLPSHFSIASSCIHFKHYFESLQLVKPNNGLQRCLRYRSFSFTNDELLEHG